MGFLWEGARFRISDSKVTTSNGGDALLYVESESVRLRFVLDRGQLFLDMQSISSAKGEWFSIDLIRRMFFGNREATAVLDESYASFLESHLDQVEERFDANRWVETRRQLKSIKVKRAKEMFD